jgi:hypothetical protein
MKRIKLVRCTLKPQYQIISEKFYYVFIERLCLIIIGAVWFDKDKLKAVVCTIFSIVNQVLEEVIHVRLENISKVDWIVDLSKDKHEIF